MKFTDEYAKGAVAELTRQLGQAQAETKKAKLRARIAKWNERMKEKK